MKTGMQWILSGRCVSERLVCFDLWYLLTVCYVTGVRLSGDLSISTIMVKKSPSAVPASPQPEHLAALSVQLADLKKKSKAPTSSNARNSSAPKPLTKDQILCLSSKGAHASLAELKSVSLTGRDAFMRLLKVSEEHVQTFKSAAGNVGRNAPANGEKRSCFLKMRCG